MNFNGHSLPGIFVFFLNFNFRKKIFFKDVSNLRNIKMSCLAIFSYLDDYYFNIIKN